VSRIHGVLLSLGLLGCAGLKQTDVPAPVFYPPPDRVPFASDVRSASAIVAGTLIDVRRDFRYEAPCGLVHSILGLCDDRRAYVGRVRVDSSLTGASGTVEIVFFVREDGVGVGRGTTALWLLRYRRVTRGDQCSRYGCLDEWWLGPEGDGDVLPSHDWPVVAALRKPGTS
jgi:hypothetical protein